MRPVKYVIGLSAVLLFNGCGENEQSPNPHPLAYSISKEVNPDTVLNSGIVTKEPAFRVSQHLTWEEIRLFARMDPIIDHYLTVDSITVRGLLYDLGNGKLWTINITDDMGLNEGLFVYQKEQYMKRVIHIPYDYNAFSSDTAFDADFDGDLDYIVGEYSGTGCCPRLGQTIHLNKGGMIDTAGIYTFNAGFDAETEFVVSMGYGHMPYNYMEKHVWRADTLLLVESVFARGKESLEGEWIKADPPYTIVNQLTGEEKAIRAQDIPEEYQYVYDFEWFLY